eukprot:2463881-Pyramimonas_sp.AAC.1
MYSQTALSRATSSQFLPESRSRVGRPYNSFRRRADNAQESRCRHGFLTVYFGIALSLEISSRFMQDARFSNPLVRLGR